MAPRKVRLMAGLIRGLSVTEAEAQLMVRSRRAAEPLLVLLRSCAANARQAKLNPANMIISKITVDQGPMLKRFLPRAMGRATPIHKKMSHVLLVLSESAKATAPRFTFVKKEQPKKEEKKHKASKAVKEGGSPESKGAAKEKQSFFKRVFRRTSV